MADRTESLASKENRSREGLVALLAAVEARRTQFLDLLPSEIPFEVFKDTFKLAIQQNNRLMDADRDSLFIALQKAAIDGLRPDGREGALVIFGDDQEDDEGNVVKSTAGKPKRVQWMPMIAGLIKQVRNTGEVTNVRAAVIYEGETFSMSDEDGQLAYKHERRMARDFDDTDEKIVGAYAVIQFKDGSWDMEPMSRRQIDRVRAVSKAKKGPWLPWYSEMAKKTVLRRLLKRQQHEAANRALASIDRDESMIIEGDLDEARPVTEPARLPTPTPQVDIGLNRQPAQNAGVAEDPADASLGTKARTVSDPVAGSGGGGVSAGGGTPSGGSATGRTTANTTAASGAGGAGTATTTKAPDKRVEPAKETPKPEPTPAAPEPFEHWAMDQSGQPIDDHQGEPLDSPEAFAAWFELAAGVCTDIDALVQHNADALGDVGADPAMAARIQVAVNTARARLTAKPAEEAKAAEPAAQAARPLPHPMPMTPGNKPHYPNYLAEIKPIIDAMATLDDLNAWWEINRPVSAASAATAKRVMGFLSARRDAIDAGAQAADPEPDTGKDADLVWALAACRDIDGQRTLYDLQSWGNNAAIRAKMARLLTERPDLHTMVNEASAAKMKLFGSTATKAETDGSAP
jgi:recombination protein RecT